MVFWVGISTLGEGWFLWTGVQNSLYKNSEYESQDKKMILIIIFTMCHFWSPTLTNFWWFVFVSLFSMVYAPHYHPSARHNVLTHVGLWPMAIKLNPSGKPDVSKGARISKSPARRTFCIGGPNFLFGRGG